MPSRWNPELEEFIVPAVNLGSFAASDAAVILALAMANEEAGFPYRCYCHGVVSIDFPHAACFYNGLYVPQSIFDAARVILTGSRSRSDWFKRQTDIVAHGEDEE